MRVFLTTRTCKTMRRAWTLLEILVAMGIIAVLTGSLLIGSRVVNSSRRGATARQQLQLIAAAIDRYAEFWPKWKIGSVTIADKGWPDFVAGRLFISSVDVIADYNDHVTFDIESLYGPSAQDVANRVIDGKGDLCNAGTCLVYCLTATSGKGPYVPDDLATRFHTVSDIDKRTLVSGEPPLYPGFGAGKRRRLILDPWDTPIRYFWVYRDASRTSHRGFLPVDFGAAAFDSGPTGVFNGAFNQPNAPTATQTAVGYVLESAGPDKKFGNIWKINPTAQEIADAEDNVMITRP